MLKINALTNKCLHCFCTVSWE